jgi:hypothetical protein
MPKLDVMFSSQEYELYTERVLATYPAVVYVRDSSGNVQYTNTGGVIELTVLHNAGDTMVERVDVYLSEDVIEHYYGSIVVGTGDTLDASTHATYVGTQQTLDAPIVLHEVGDVVLDAQNNPIIALDRQIIYMVDLIQVNKRLTLSAQPEHVIFFSNLSEQLNAYFEIISDAIPRLREEMHLYFKPLRSMGTAPFKIGDGISMVFDLELSITLKLYVYTHVREDASLMETIRESIIDIIDGAIEAGTVSTTAISAVIVEQMSDMVKHVDVLGINGQNDIQTLTSPDNDVIPSLKQELIIEDDGTIGVRRALDLQFVEVAVSEGAI